MSNELYEIEKRFAKKVLPDFKPGDTIKVFYKIKEGDKERLQIFEGLVIKRRKGITGSTFTVRKISHGVGVERIFPFHSPFIEKVEVVNRGKVRRANISYIREKIGKGAKIKEIIEKNERENKTELETGKNQGEEKK